MHLPQRMHLLGSLVIETDVVSNIASFLRADKSVILDAKVGRERLQFAILVSQA